jgi:alanine racemase
VANIETALAAAYLLTGQAGELVDRLRDYCPAATRMETWRSTSGVSVIRSSGPDLLSVQSGLDHMAALAGATAKQYFVLEANDQPAEFIEQATSRAKGTEVLLMEGNNAARVKGQLGPLLRYGDVVLVHAPQKAGIDAIASELIGAMAPNRFFIDLQAIQENLTRYRMHLGPSVAIYAMVKALAYGTEISHLAVAVQHLGVDGFGVSTPDEAIALRRSGVTAPILVMLCTPGEAAKMIEHDLVPVINSFDLLEAIAQATRRAGCTLEVHMEIDTGMGRTGVSTQDAVEMANQIRAAEMRLAGVMTHFASADDPRQDASTQNQIERFDECVAAIRAAGHPALMIHAANTAAAARFPNARYDMVRIGLGLYGIHPSEAVREALELMPAVALVSQISRVQEFHLGDRIGYGGTYAVLRDDFRGAVVPIGYHDGVPWSASNRGFVMVNGKRAAIVGRVSMDSMVVDVSDIPDARQGADVLIYGSYGGYTLPVEEISTASGTIPYELLARTGPRVQRIFLGL